MTTDAFLTHDWGVDELGRDNHARVSFVNEELKKSGYSTWFDSDKMTGNIVDQMCRGIDNAKVILVFITDRYCQKVGGDNESDNCKMEFSYAIRRRGVPNMIPIVMEASMANTAEWGGPLGMALGGILYVNFSGDENQILGSFGILVEEINKRTGKQTTGPPRPVQTYKPSVVETLKKGVTQVRIKKASGAGAGFYLAAHGDKRNEHSTWALVHRARPGDQDEYWNVVPWTEGGVSCFKIEKARHRNYTMMLTAHADKKPNQSVRTLVHRANHNVPDELWDIVPVGDKVKIVKALNRNKGMRLVSSEGRNGGSFWVDISSVDEDCEWEIEIIRT